MIIQRKSCDIGLDVEKHTLVGALSAERIHDSSYFRNWESLIWYVVQCFNSLFVMLFWLILRLASKSKFLFRLLNLNIVLKYTHEPKQLYKHFLLDFVKKKIHQIFFGKTSKVVKFDIRRRLKFTNRYMTVGLFMISFSVRTHFVDGKSLDSFFRSWLAFGSS